MNVDRWSATCSAFRTGAREEASSYAREALLETSESNTVLRIIHTTNLQAIDSDRTTQIQTSQLRKNPIVPSSPTTAPLSLRLYVHRVSLIAAHNHLLAILNCSSNSTFLNGDKFDDTSVRQEATNFLLTILHSIPEFMNDFLRQLPQTPLASSFTKTRQTPSRNQNEATTGAVKVIGAYDWVYEISDIAQNVMNHIGLLSEKLSSDELLCLEGWARSVADAFDLVVAETILDTAEDGPSTVMGATAYASAAEALRTMARTAGPNVECDDITSSSADLAVARTVWMQSLSLARAGDEEAALTSVLPTARAILESRHYDDIDGEDIDNAGKEAMYLAAVLLLRRGGSDMDECAEFARGCAERMFRTSDSLALVARAGTGKAEDVERWAVALAVDGSPRPAGLWLTSRAFGRMGMYERRAEILELAEDALAEHDNEDGENIDMQDATENVKGDRVVRLDEKNIAHGILEHGEDVRSCLEVESLRAERGRALCAAGRVEEGRALLQESGVILDPGSHSGAQLAVEWALADRAMTKEEAEKSLIETESHKLMHWERMGIFIARAERMLRGGLVREARRAMDEAMRIGLQIELENSGSEAFLRGICYGNTAVVRVCDGDVMGADEWFAAAQTALDKAIEENTYQEQRSSFARVKSSQAALERAGLQLGTLATFGRCIAMAMCGRRSDAAGHWVAKRGLQGASIETNLPGGDSFPMVGRSSEAEEPAVSDKETLLPRDSNAPEESHSLVTTVARETLLEMDKVCLEITHHDASIQMGE